MSKAKIIKSGYNIDGWINTFRGPRFERKAVIAHSVVIDGIAYGLRDNFLVAGAIGMISKNANIVKFVYNSGYDVLGISLQDLMSMAHVIQHGHEDTEIGRASSAIWAAEHPRRSDFRKAA